MSINIYIYIYISLVTAYAFANFPVTLDFSSSLNLSACLNCPPLKINLRRFVLRFCALDAYFAFADFASLSFLC